MTSLGPVGGTFSEMLSLVAMGKGVLPVGEHSRTYYPRPDVAYVPVRDAPPIERGAVWPATNTTTRVRESAVTQLPGDATALGHLMSALDTALCT
ncbi:hypothetical protein [Microbispora catharanthi]|uniref:hypothetical protein n=1 Tax=Microbispora catharanthi TaxID=1712871 RepID=UPI00197C0E8D|nr:hypothetical protein [Microbispora catharanthi]